MSLFQLFLTFFVFVFLSKPDSAFANYQAFVNSEKLTLSRSDLMIAEKILSLIKMVEKGYVNGEVLRKVIKDVKKSKNYVPFQSWLKSIQLISTMKSSQDLLSGCRPYTKIQETLPLERVLEKIAGNYCREKALEAIGREIDKSKVLRPEVIQFIQENLPFFLTKKNKNNFAFFLQSQSDEPEILKQLSKEVTTYSVQHEIVPSQEVLKDIVINEQITKLIQDKGFNLLIHQNVFYAEYGKLINLGYDSLDGKPVEKKVKEHFKFLKNYLELNDDHLPMGLCLNRMNDFAKAVFRDGLKDLSREIFKYIVSKNNLEIQEDALFFYLWTHWAENEFKEALALAKKHDLLNGKTIISDARLKFWIALSHEEVDEKKEAIPLYEDIVLNSPLSFYAIMSVKKIQKLKPDSPAVSFYSAKSLETEPKLSFEHKDLEADHLSSLIRLRAWAKLDNERLMKLELKRLKLHNMPKTIVKQSSEKQFTAKSDLHLVNARIMMEAENYLASFRYLYDVLDSKEVTFNRAVLQILYPKPFLKELKRALRKTKIDPIILLSLIRQESVFNPLARSRVGARGLMQLMPATARRMRRSVRDKHLVIPRINIQLGTKYFKGLMKRYDGNLVYVLSAYNAGEGRVERWKNHYFDIDESILKNIESIPFLETRNYVKLIFRNIFFYKILLDEEELVDPSEHNKIFDVQLGFKH